MALMKMPCAVGTGGDYLEYDFDPTVTISGSNPTTIETLGKVSKVYVGVVRKQTISDKAGIRLKGDNTVIATMGSDDTYIMGTYDTSAYSSVTIELYSQNGNNSPSGKFDGFVLYK